MFSNVKPTIRVATVDEVERVVSEDAKYQYKEQNNDVFATRLLSERPLHLRRVVTELQALMGTTMVLHIFFQIQLQGLLMY